jgi:Undecaprenyl-phosphate galactose phosphotransferase WbaP
MLATDPKTVLPQRPWATYPFPAANKFRRRTYIGRGNHVRIKRLLDLALTIVGGFVALPLFISISVAIKLNSPGPILYSQKRVGRGSRYFRAWKFRTMVTGADQVLLEHLDADPELRKEWEQDHKLKNDPRVTWVGRWLRTTSLDELPQLYNVLLGQMSLVGPRPIVDAEIGKYGETFELYKMVSPGITGLWQVSGRNNTTYQERVALDSYYVRNWSPWFDLYILMRTIKVVLLREGAY